jgi:hypothetical protein
VNDRAWVRREAVVSRFSVELLVENIDRMYVRARREAPLALTVRLQ